MYFEDLELCRYHRGPCNADEWRSPLLAVGWLEYPRVFKRGITEPDLCAKLEAMISAARELYPHVNFRGLHPCDLCPSEEVQLGRFVLSHVNIFVPGDRVIYIAPGLITHYVGDHHYLPPAGFIGAVMNCPDYGSPAFCAALREANADCPPPLQTKEEDHAQWMLEHEKCLAWRREQQASKKGQVGEG